MPVEASMAAAPTGSHGTRSTTHVRQLHFDLAARPFLVLFELTGACALACAHCRADAVPDPGDDDLETEQVLAVLEDLGRLGSPRPHVVFTGGDPLQRPDLDCLVAAASERRLAVGVAAAGTPLAAGERLSALRRAGASVLSFSLDAQCAERHDRFRRVPGSFGWTVAACVAARESGMRLQINSTVCRETVLELPGLARLVRNLGANLWSVFLLVPVGRGRLLEPLSAEETEDVLLFLADLSSVLPLKTTEAPAFRRVLQQRAAGLAAEPGELHQALWRRLRAVWPAGAEMAAKGAGAAAARRSPLAVGDGRGVVFVSRTGAVLPSGFLPLEAGSVLETPLTRLYRESPLLASLRDPARLRGRCGLCSYATTCGGSRAQAFSSSGDPLGEDPSCAYRPLGVPPTRHGA